MKSAQNSLNGFFRQTQPMRVSSRRRKNRRTRCLISPATLAHASSVPASPNLKISGFALTQSRTDSSAIDAQPTMAKRITVGTSMPLPSPISCDDQSPRLSLDSAGAFSLRFPSAARTKIKDKAAGGVYGVQSGSPRDRYVVARPSSRLHFDLDPGRSEE